MAWMTGGRVAHSLETLSPACVGRCERFHVGYYRPPDGPREAVMVFDGCRPGRGCSLLIQSPASASEGALLEGAARVAVQVAACCLAQQTLLAYRAAVSWPVCEALADALAR